MSFHTGARLCCGESASKLHERPVGTPGPRTRRVRGLRSGASLAVTGRLDHRGSEVRDGETVFHGAFHRFEPEGRGVDELRREGVPEGISPFVSGPDRVEVLPHGGPVQPFGLGAAARRPAGPSRRRSGGGSGVASPSLFAEFGDRNHSCPSPERRAGEARLIRRRLGPHTPENLRSVSSITSTEAFSDAGKVIFTTSPSSQRISSSPSAASALGAFRPAGRPIP